MSHHYSASQFDHAFKPIRLNVYTPFTSMPEPPHGVHAMCLPTRCSTTEVIACDNGALFPWKTRGPSSPWGDYSTSIWEETCSCCCIPQIRNPKKNCCLPQKYIYVSMCEPDKRRNKCIPKKGCRKAVYDAVRYYREAHKVKPRPRPAVLTPLDKKFMVQEAKHKKLEKKKIEQIRKKTWMDCQDELKRVKIMEQFEDPPDGCYWKKIYDSRMKPFKPKKSKKEPGCPACLDAPCCVSRAGQGLQCCLLSDEMANNYPPLTCK